MFENVASKYEIDQKANIAKFQSNSVAIARKNNTSRITVRRFATSRTSRDYQARSRDHKQCVCRVPSCLIESELTLSHATSGG